MYIIVDFCCLFNVLPDDMSLSFC